MTPLALFDRLRELAPQLRKIHALQLGQLIARDPARVAKVIDRQLSQRMVDTVRLERKV